MINFESEIFVDVNGYEGMYQVSNLGRVKSLFRKDMRSRTIKEIYLKPFKDGNKGYVAVSLLKNGIPKRVKLHRLVAEAFLEKEEFRDQVNHKNGQKNDNRAVNLEWVTSSQNRRHAFDVLGVKSSGGHKGKLGSDHHCSFMVEGTNIKTGEIRIYGSTAEAARNLGIGSGSIPRVCNGKYKSSKGWVFKYVESGLHQNSAVHD